MAIVGDDEPLVFRDTVDSALGSVVRTLDDGTKRKLTAVGINFDKPLLPAYPNAVFAQALKLCAAAAYPGLSEAEGFRMLGRITVERLQETLLGRAQLSLAKVIGPMKCMLRISKNVRSAANKVDAETQQVGDKSVLISVIGYRLPHPEYQVGALEALLQALGNAGKVHIVKFDAAKELLDVRVDVA